MTTLAWLIAVVALGLGLLAGAALARRPSAGRPARRTAVASRTPDDRPSAAAPTLGELLHRTFRQSDSGLAVVGAAGDVLLHNPRAAALGAVTEDRLDPRAWAACQRVQAGDRLLEVDLSPLDRTPRGPVAVQARIHALGDGFTLVEAVDTSEVARLEATRRDFVANVSHELKTPVGAVALLAEALLDTLEGLDPAEGSEDDAAEVRQFGEKLLREATRMGNLVSELIALSRLTGAERLPELAAVEVDDVASEALARSRNSAESHGVEITADGPSGLVVDGDRTLLVTALTNLVENAIAYSPTDSSVSVSRREVGGSVEIAVTDRGIGIAPEHQKRVFERFFRVDPARSRATGGTGLGLAIVKHVCANHGGEVRLWSRPGTGSTFTMRLPARLGVKGPRGAAGSEAPETATTGG
ncbi:Phosphate regulon sensor protein PhoR (SphS) [Pseudonocardia sp. Ae168_Ps1]|uniref:sensor histidine kinase n=1 Tax=unclassified Pseudonocardia TaxID=2619320 RepID=UPI00095B2926|nr:MULTISPECIES: ATP-binding protein [unclassified Pseudonocardia]OLL74306.1 Phosphate regulon sensor protein PhoR (SphS) [Pseudonocardia sp. Ae150A_Ps1]OLL80288.1 Phosphate regulon sensor protein PhoR (SphS) [Pseudonocardia sp. Ae168_Ps1]OLL85586.1 Phosphate regulon sensor protein PhoR (SphS) [Pseudonocardia sp. Ae263_Ps1]OLL94386.1 Phosphate regulon sensor protein PhoR (SphS) [Pseudonocardia sp. Ae356_Ps1]